MLAMVGVEDWGLGFFVCWSAFVVCDLALQWLEVRVGVCDPSFFFSVFGVCEFVFAVVGVEEWNLRSIDVSFLLVCFWCS